MKSKGNAHLTLSELLVVEKIADFSPTNDSFFSKESNFSTFSFLDAEESTDKPVNCANEKDFNEFLNWAFTQINKHGKQYLATQNMNSKLAMYNQMMKSEKVNYDVSIQSGLSRPKSRLSSSVLKRYPLVSRKTDEESISRLQAACLGATSKSSTPVAWAAGNKSKLFRPRSPEVMCDPFVRNQTSSNFEIALSGKCIMQPRPVFLMRASSPAVEGRAAPPLGTPPHAAAHDAVLSNHVCGRVMIVKQLIEPHDSRRPLLRRSPADIATKRAAALEPVDAAPPPQTAATPTSAGERLDPVGAVPAAAAAGEGGGRDARRSVVVRMLHGGLAPDS